MKIRSKIVSEIDQFFNIDFSSISAPFLEVLGEVLGGFLEVLGSPGASKSSKTRCRKVNIVQDASRRRFGALFWCPRASQEAPKRLARGSQEAPKTGQEAPKSSPRWGNSSRKSQEGLKRLPRRPKSSQEGPKRAQEGPQRVPRGSQVGPRAPQEGPPRCRFYTHSIVFSFSKTRSERSERSDEFREIPWNCDRRPPRIASQM